MLYARQLAWLQHRPERPGKAGEDKTPGPTRYEQFEAAGSTPVLPPVEAQHIIDWLHQLGWCMPSGMGIGPLPATEIEAWARLSQTFVDPWQFAAMRAGSSAYASQSSNDTHQPPWGEQEQPKPKVAGVFKALAKKVNK